MTAVVNARSRESVSRSEHQSEASAHAESDHADLAVAAFLAHEPRADCFDFIERSSLLRHAVAGDLSQTADFAAPMEQVRRGSKKAFARQPFGLIAQVGLHSTHIVDDHHSRPRPRAWRRGHVSWQIAPATWNRYIRH